MAQLPEHLAANPIWHALTTEHTHLALRAGDAARYPADVAPFAAVAAPTPDAFGQFASLLSPGELVWIADDPSPSPALKLIQSLPCLQMVLPTTAITPAIVPASGETITRLSAADAPAMVALTDVAFPGFFRPRTCLMGSYFGIHDHHGSLIAMGGERLRLPGLPEISGLCTHPAHRGKGLAAALLSHLVHMQRRKDETSWLHVVAANTRAIALYHRLGFVTDHTVTLHQVSLPAEP